MLSWVLQFHTESEEVGFFFSSPLAVPLAQGENDQAIDFSATYRAAGGCSFACAFSCAALRSRF